MTQANGTTNGTKGVKPLALKQHSVDAPHPIKVIVIGAGVSGILSAIRLQQYVPGVDLTVYEKNPALGGTWFENRYPGLACDIPSHVYQYTFEHNTQWSSFFSGGPEILKYVQGVAKKYEVEKYIKYNSRICEAIWDQESGKWKLKVESGGEVNEDECDVLFSASGVLNNWKWPDIAGLKDFKGKLLHSADWDESWDYTGKSVAIIGCGSSAIQILPKMQKLCTKVDHYVRGKTYLSYPFGGEYSKKVIERDMSAMNFKYTDEEKKAFAENPELYFKYRKEVERAINLDHACLFPGSVMQKAGLESILNNMRTKLAKKPEIYRNLIPSWLPGCRRLTPGPGYLEALVEDNVEFITDSIVKITQEGILTADGKERKVDAIVCATGFDTSHTPRYPTIGKNGISLAEHWKEYPTAYMSLATVNFPNLFIVGGPNSATGGGSLLIIFESVISYIVKCIQKMQREKLLSMEISPAAEKAWIDYCDAYFPGTVHVSTCRSWYKGGKEDGRVVGLWPGSSNHANRALKHPRWEDWVYRLRDESEGLLGWLGDGWTEADRLGGDTSSYLDEADIPPVPVAVKSVELPN